MLFGPYLIPTTLVFRFLTVGLAASLDTVMVILRLTPFNFAVTTAVPAFFWDQIASENCQNRWSAGFCAFDTQAGAALQIDKGTHGNFVTDPQSGFGSTESCYGF